VHLDGRRHARGRREAHHHDGQVVLAATAEVGDDGGFDGVGNVEGGPAGGRHDLAEPVLAEFPGAAPGFDDAVGDEDQDVFGLEFEPLVVGFVDVERSDEVAFAGDGFDGSVGSSGERLGWPPQAAMTLKPLADGAMAR